MSNVTNLKGTVEDIKFTFGGAGNQVTKIDGVDYITFWNVMTKDWKVGDKVTFDKFSSPIWHGQSPVLQARNIRKSVIPVAT